MFPSPSICFYSLTRTVESNNHTLLSASIKPRATWNGEGYDIAYTGYVIGQCNRRGTLTRWSYDLRRRGTLTAAVTHDVHYRYQPTYEGILELLTHSQREGAWHLCRDHDGMWIEVNNKETLASYLVDRMITPIAV